MYSVIAFMNAYIQAIKTEMEQSKKIMLNPMAPDQVKHRQRLTFHNDQTEKQDTAPPS